MLDTPSAEVRISSRLNANQTQRLHECIQVVRDAQRQSIEAAMALAIIKDERLYIEHGNFSDFAREHFGIGSSRAYQLARAGKLYEHLREAGTDPLPTNEGQLRPLAKLDDLSDQRSVWEKVLKQSGGKVEVVTKEAVELTVEALLENQTAPQEQDSEKDDDEDEVSRDTPLTHQEVEDHLRRFGRDAARLADVAGELASGEAITNETLHQAIEVYESVLAADGYRELPYLVDQWGLLGDEAPEVEKSEDGVNRLLLSVPAAYYRESPPGHHTVLVAQEAVERRLGRGLDSELIADMRSAVAEAGYKPLFNRTNEHVDWAWWTWNPLTGCGQGCVFCYARDIANRLYPQGFAETFYPGRLNAPANTRLPKGADTNPWARNVFTVSMGDLFRNSVSDAIIHAVLDEIAAHPEWQFLLLTKFAKRLPHFEFPDNAWIGTSIVSQEWVKPAEAAFSKVKARVKWISAEPLLSPLEFTNLGLWDWIVIGAQSRSSGAPALQPERSWVDGLKRDARAAGLRIYEKENLSLHLKEFPT